MVFTPEENKVPTSIGDISIVVSDFETGTDAVEYRVNIKDANGDIFDHKRGNLAPHLSAESITKLQEVAAEVRTKAQVFIP